LSKGQAILWRWREGWRDGSRGGERRGRGVMGMVLGHIFNHVTKTVHAWETRLCFSNPAGRLRSTLLRSTHSNNLERNKSDFYLFFLVTPTFLLSGEAGRKAREANNKKTKTLSNVQFSSTTSVKHWIYLCYATETQRADSIMTTPRFPSISRGGNVQLIRF